MSTRTVWSLVAVKPNGRRGKLIGHVDGADGVTLANARPYVDAAAAKRVAAPEAHREVCAWVIGQLDGVTVAVYRNLQRSTKVQPAAPARDYVTYDRECCVFVSRADGALWTGAATVRFTDRMREV